MLSLWALDHLNEHLHLEGVTLKRPLEIVGRGSFGVVLQSSAADKCVKVIRQSHTRSPPVEEFARAMEMGRRGLGPSVYATGHGYYQHHDDQVHWMLMSRHPWSLHVYIKALHAEARRMQLESPVRRQLDCTHANVLVCSESLPPMLLCDFE